MSSLIETNLKVPSIPLYKLKEVRDFSETEGRRIFIELTEDEIYPSSHEDDMGETDFHYELTSYLRNALKLFFQERKDVFVAANMNLYYQENNPYKWLAPDLMVVFGVDNHPRRTFKLWQEQIFPQVLFEVASDSTYQNDISEKAALYEQLGVEEYYVIDSENFLTNSIMAFRRQNDALRLLSLSENRIFSPRLGLEIVDSNQEVRLFNPIRQEFLPNLAEAAAKSEAAQIEIEDLKAELARLKGEN